jgi:adenosine deaminase
MADAGTDRSIDSALHDMAKVELHVHLEGSFTGERIAELAAEAGQEMPADPASILACDSLPDLLARLDWWCGLVRTPEQAERQAHDFAVSMAGDGIAYAEVIVNPTHWSGLARPALLEAVSSGFARAAAEGGADCWLLVSLLRSQTAEEALAVVAELERRPPARLVGLSIDGNEAETGPTGARFAPAFAAAGALGLGLTAHAGESSGAEGVTSALDDLGVSRIDHGIRIVEDPAVLARVADEGVTLDVCLTSNVNLLYGHLEAHPLRRLVAAGVAVTINTDDPATLGVTLTGEMALAARHCGWGLAGAIKATEQAISASFASESLAADLRRLLKASTAESS